MAQFNPGARRPSHPGRSPLHCPCSPSPRSCLLTSRWCVNTMCSSGRRSNLILNGRQKNLSIYAQNSTSGNLFFVVFFRGVLFRAKSIDTVFGFDGCEYGVGPKLLLRMSVCIRVGFNLNIYYLTTRVNASATHNTHTIYVKMFIDINIFILLAASVQGVRSKRHIRNPSPQEYVKGS